MMFHSILTISSRSCQLLLCIVLLVLTSNINQIHGLSVGGGFFRQRNNSSSSGVASRGGRSSNRTGKKNNIINNQSNNNELPTTQQETVVSTTAVNEGQLSSSSIFDADSYRQEMTNLVYQRNLQRLCV